MFCPLMQGISQSSREELVFHFVLQWLWSMETLMVLRRLIQAKGRDREKLLDSYKIPRSVVLPFTFVEKF
jgi:hypothetical protein